MRKMTKVRTLLGALAVIVLVVSAAGCGIVSDQTKQEAQKKVEAKKLQVKKKVKAKSQQAGQEAKKRVEAKGQQVE